jgi:diguanylate cyclase (GGDEF)-like protein/PAS domain S-box-containing protein
MENKNINDKLSHDIKPSIVYKRDNLVLIVISIIILFWIIESAIETLAFLQNTTFLQQLFKPSSHELWIRFLFILLLILLGIYFRRVLTRLTVANTHLRQEVEERQHAEQAYKDLMIKNEMILTSAGEGIYGLDASGKVTFVNPAAAAISRYDPEELIGRDIHAMLHHTKADGAPYPKEDCPIYKSWSSGQVQRVSRDLFWTRQGDSFPVEYVSAPILKDGQVDGAVVVFRDITSRVRAEAALEEERDFISTLLDTISVLVVVLDPQGHIVRFNRASEAISGYSFQEVAGQPIWELFIPPEDVEAIKKVFSSLLIDQVPREHESYWISRDGQRRLIAWSNTAVRDAGGRVTHVIGTGIDVTERRRAEQELKQAKDYLENVLDNSADAIGIVDRKGNIIKWNKASADAFGYSAAELTGKSAFELYADKSELEEMLTRLRRDGSVRGHEIHMKKKDGSIPLFALSINLLYDQHHDIIGSVCVARDRSEIKRTLHDLAALNEQLQIEIAERREVEAALQAANDNLKDIIRQFEQRNREITLLNEMGDLLQACLTCQEAYEGIAHFAASLFPDESGALFILNAPKTLMESVTAWGQPEIGEAVFSPDECWALRRGEIHAVDSQQPGLICPHLTKVHIADHMCIPLVAQGEIMGLILLQNRVCALDAPPPLAEQLIESRQRLALTLARQISLALANLKLRDSLRAQALRDPLTGLFNRRYMEETLDREILRVQRRNQPLALIMVDLDNLKPINDSRGHEAGDQVIKALGRFLKSQVRREDVACRYGGDEFTLIMPEASLEIACQRAELVRQGINRLRVVHGDRSLGPITASFGVATFPDHGTTGEDLVRAADAALYHAKQQGRNQLGIALTADKLALSREPEIQTRH